MIDPDSHHLLQAEITQRIAEDRAVLDQLRAEIGSLARHVRPIQPRGTTSVSLVGTDGGNTRIQFDPFLVQLVRVVDSHNNEYCLEAITPTTRVSALGDAQFDAGGTPRTALGKMMAYLGVRELPALSPMIRPNDDGRPISPSWVQVYRELVEWATLFAIVRDKEFASDTLLVADGLLRSKVFARDLFRRYLTGIEEAIARHYQQSRRRITLAGLAKHSKVLTRYRLAMALEGILTTPYPAYVEIPRPIESKDYIWSEYARGDDVAVAGRELNKFVGGKMFFVKFGSRPHDPIWPVDIFLPQRGEAPTILGCLLADAQNGFPVPFYPLCLQRAHENAALVDFDFDLLQDQIVGGIRALLGPEAPALDALQLQDEDPARSRYA
jgi:hypothetical protein